MSKIYTVYQGYGDEEPTVCEGEVAKETKKTIRFAGRSGLAFECRSTVNFDEFDSMCIARTAREAVDLYVAKCERALRKASAREDAAISRLLDAKRLQARTR